MTCQTTRGGSGLGPASHGMVRLGAVRLAQARDPTPDPGQDDQNASDEGE